MNKKKIIITILLTFIIIILFIIFTLLKDSFAKEISEIENRTHAIA